MAGKTRRMARVMEGFMNQIHIERGGTVDPREQKALIEGRHVERKEAEQNQTGGNPLLSPHIEGLFHKSVANYCVIYSYHPSEASLTYSCTERGCDTLSGGLAACRAFAATSC
jgi:hypothetical protein